MVAAAALLAAACTTPGTGGNPPPIGVINADTISGEAPLTVSFSGASSTDNGTITSYAWTFGDPASGASNTASGVTATHTFASAGSYTVQLTVTDNGGATSTTSTVILVSVPNAPPVAVATDSAPTSGTAPLQVQFSSNGSNDPDGSIVAYSWDFGDGLGTSTDDSPTYLYSTPGDYTATLSVLDDDGAENTTSVAIHVDANLAPTASATATPQNGTAPLTVAFDGTGSTDPENQALTYAWDFGDPASGTNTATTATASHTYSTTGPFTATLTVTDAGGLTDTTTVPVSVTPANQPPVADASTSSPLTGKAPLAVTFDSAGSTDDDGIVSYAWNFDDPSSGSNTATGQTATHTYATAGTYDATLTVTDGDGATDSATVQVVVALNQAPTAIANVSTNTGTAPASIDFTSASTDVDGGVTSTTWDFGDGTPDATTANATHVYSLPGTYTATLTVADAEGATDAATVTITVTGVATARYVATTGTDTGDCGSQGAACATVQYAADQAAAGDTVYVAPGAYDERVGLAKDVKIVGANAGVAGTAARGPESVIKGVGNAFVGSIVGASNTSYSGSVADVSGTSTTAISGITGAGAINGATGAGAISGVTGVGVSPIVVTTSAAHNLTTGSSITLASVGGNTNANGVKTVTVIDSTHFSLDGTTGNANYTSGGRWYGGPVVLSTTVPHGLTVGSTITGVTIASLGGNTAANGTNRSLTVLDANRLQVNGVVGNNTYTSGGGYYNIVATYETATPHKFVTGQAITIGGGATLSGNRTATVVDATHFTIGVNTTSATIALGNVVSRYTTITTSAAHNIPNGATATFAGVTGNTAANGAKAVTVLDPTHLQTTTAATGDYTGGGTYTSAPIIIETATPSGLTNPRIQVQDVRGNTAANGTWSTTTVDATHLLLNTSVANGAYTGGGHYGSPSGTILNGATNASPIVVATTGPHGLLTGSVINIAGALGNTAANGTWTVTAVDATHVALNGSTGNGNYTSGGNMTPAQLSVTIDGMKIDPQGDQALLVAGGTSTPAPLVSLYGGPSEIVRNTVFTGGTFAPGCSFTCTTNVDYALQVQVGGFSFDRNLVQNFRRPLNITQALFTGVPTTAASVTNSTFTGTTSRAIALSGATGTSLAGVTVTGNTIDSTGHASGPAGMTITNGGNTISGNTFKGLSTGIYLDQCKKWDQSNNTITGNTFDANSSAGVWVTVDPDGGQCTNGTAEGSGGWVTNGGKLENLKITGNVFINGTGWGVYRVSSWGANTPVVTTSDADVTCNYWGDGTAPTDRANGLRVTGGASPTFVGTPYTTSIGGPCDGN
ncbi:beta strand repeat-containing protein [Dermatobacter hominis]|uniref:beta strand repeat-containing protein n=1 Tax=Dermatobacter hominis TaxID=2884263 RepID=UPI0035ABF47D